jgi:hypothetical protein
MIWGSNPGRARDLCPLQNVKTHFGAHPASWSLGIWLLSQGQNRQGMCVTSQLDSQVKNQWSLCLPYLCVFMACTGTTLPFLWFLSPAAGCDSHHIGLICVSTRTQSIMLELIINNAVFNKVALLIINIIVISWNYDWCSYKLNVSFMGLHWTSHIPKHSIFYVLVYLYVCSFTVNDF